MQNCVSASTTATIRTTQTPKVAIHLAASRVVSPVVSVAVANTRSHSSSRLVEGVVGSRSDMETSIKCWCFYAGFVGMMLDEDARMLHALLNETEYDYGLKHHHCIIIFPSLSLLLHYGERDIPFANC